MTAKIWWLIASILISAFLFFSFLFLFSFSFFLDKKGVAATLLIVTIVYMYIVLLIHSKNKNIAAAFGHPERLPWYLSCKLIECYIIWHAWCLLTKTHVTYNLTSILAFKIHPNNFSKNFNYVRFLLCIYSIFYSDRLKNGTHLSWSIQ